MKKVIFTLLLVCICFPTWGQIETKVSSDLQTAISRQTNLSEKYRIIITMNEKYDQVQMTRQTQYMQKTEKRAYVINELQRFSSASQQDVLHLLNDGTRGGSVNDVHSFWLFNGITCEATADIIYEVAQNRDVNGIYLDYYVNRLPADWDEGATEPLRGNAWNVEKVNADDVWALGYTGAGVLVGIIDTGVKYTHTDIANNMWDGGSAYPNHGYDFHNNDNDPIDDNGHGTHCAGTISSYGTNGTQCGIAKNAKIMALKVLGSDGRGYLSTSWIAEEFAVSHGCDILSMSLGSDGLGPYSIERDILVNVLNCGVVASIAAGNVGDDLTTYPVPGNVGSPGNCPSPWGNPDQTNILNGGHSACVTVGATTSSDELSYFSSVGPVTWAEGDDRGSYNDYPYSSGSNTQIGLIKPDVAAPGSSIVSLNYSGTTGYSTKNGTSMATPCVAGIMALMLEVDPTLTPVEIDSILETTATQLGGYSSKNNKFGAGRVDALTAVNAILNACNPPTALAGTVDGCSVNLNWTAASGVSTYRVYRNGIVIASRVSGTTYTDSEAPAGHNSYYVRSNCSNGSTSESSNIVSFDIEVNTQIDAPYNLTATPNGNDVNLSWSAPTTRTATLGYATTEDDIDGGNSETIFYFAQRYPSAMLQQYAGMQVNKIYFYPGTIGTTYTVKIHKGDAMLPGEVVYTTTKTPSSVAMQEITLSSPLIIDPTEDYWLVINAYGTMGYDLAENCTDGFYYTYGDYDFYLNDTDLAWTMYMAISDAPYKYDVYRDSQLRSRQKIAEGLTTTSYTDHLTQSGSFEYSVTAVSNGYESMPSNSVQIEPGGIIIAATANPAAGGTITGAGNYIEGTTATLTATPNLGYAFVNWTEHNQQVSANPTYNFTVTGPRTLVANFQSIPQNNITYASVSNGTISGPTSSYPGQTVTLTATPANGYAFGSWNVYKTGDPSTTVTVTNNQFVMPSYDVTVSATFIVNPEYAINLACNVSLGTFTADHTSAIAGTTITLSATANTGYYLSTWIVSKADDPSVLVDVANNAFTMPAYDVNVAAVFVADEVQDTYFVGTDGSVYNNTNIPTHLYYKYSLSQSIYTPTQLGTGACKITEIAIYYGSTTAANRTMDIYMAHTNSTSFSSNTGWIKPTNANKVFSGTVSITGSAGWKKIKLNTPFEYNGTSNLVITFDDNTGSWKADDLNFYVFNSGSNTSIYYYNDNNNLNPTSVTQTATGRLTNAPILRLILDVEQPSSASLAVVPCELSGFEYDEGNGPSLSQMASIISANNNNDITVNAPTDYEVSMNPEGPYTSTLNILNPWLYYDNGIFKTSIGAGGAVYWGSMFPSSLLTNYSGGSLSKVALYTNSGTTGTFTLNIYTGGDSAPQTLVHTQDFTPGTTEGLTELILTTPIAIDATKNLWITFYQTGTDYPACTCKDTGDGNNRWISFDGTTWTDLNNAGISDRGWIIRGYIDMSTRGEQLLALPEFRGNVGAGFATEDPAINRSNHQNRDQVAPVGVVTTPIYTRLKANLTEGEYNDEMLTLSSGNNTTNVTLNGQVISGVHYTITVNADPTEGGIVSGGGDYLQNQTVNVIAEANRGFAFNSWEENDIAVSTSPTYSFTATADRSLTAHFDALTLRNITYAATENGTVEGPVTSYPGETVNLTLTPASSYAVESIEVYKTGDESTTVSVTNHSFVMPDYNVTVSVSFVFSPYHDITFACIEHGNVTSNVSSAMAGTTINLTATPNAGYVLGSLVVYKADDTNTTIPITDGMFTMPDFDVVVVAFFATQSSNDAQYVKVTTEPTDWSGEYLIVYEATNMAFNGGLTTLDATSNYISVSISNNAIASSTTTDAATFTIAPYEDYYSIRSKSGYYIGRTGSSNGLNTSLTAAYSNELNYDDGDCEIVSNGLYLMFNNQSGQNRFRYYTSYNQKPVQLYKKVTTSVSGVGLASSTCSLEAFSYAEGNGPSTTQSFTVYGTNISDNVTVTAPTDYEVCATEFGTYANSINLAATNGNLAGKVYIRLKAGLTEGNYNELLTLSSETTTQSVSLEGTVTEATVAPWSPVGNEYEISMTLIGIIQINGVEQTRTTLEVGAFCGDECRGTQRAMLAPTGKYLVPMTIHGEAGEQISFRLFDHLSETVLDYSSPTSVTVSEEGYGTLTNPHVLNFKAPFVFVGSPNNNEWDNNDNWEGGVIPGNDDYVIIDGLCELSIDIEVSKISVNENSSITITDGHILTAGEIITTAPSQLVIEDGAQLYCNSANVQASFHKTIEKTTNDTDGWYTIASPMSNPTIQNLTSNTFDIYAYDEDADQQEWQNYRVSNFNFESGHGYLYANSAAIGEDETDLVMTGALTPSNAPITVSLSYAATYEGIRGFNLIGNPYPHNISMSDVKVNGVAITEFYRLSNDNQLVRCTSSNIRPGESFFIKATATNQSVVIGGE